MKFSLLFRRPRIAFVASTMLLAMAGLICLSFTFKSMPGAYMESAWNLRTHGYGEY